MYATGLAAPQILVDRDPEAAEAVRQEIHRQQNSLVLIASENHASQAVLEASASVMTNKYAEGYPGRRYYAGCEFVDVAESLAIERVNRLFGSEHANVQPHSGTQANLAVYTALMQPGETLMGMRLDHGGHLSHGSPVNFTGKFYNIVSYGVHPDTELIDYEQVEALAKEHRPRFIVAGYSAYARTVDWARFRAIADEVGAILLVDMAHIAGLVAGGVHPSPVPHAQIVTSTTHKSLRGPRGAFILSTQEHARALDRSVFPVNQGGPFMAAILAKAVCFGEALQPGLCRLRPAHRRQRQSPRRRAHRRRLPHRHRRHRHPPLPRRPPRRRPHRTRGRVRPQRRRRLRQPQHDPERPPARDGRQRPPHRHPSPSAPAAWPPTT